MNHFRNTVADIGAATPAPMPTDNLSFVPLLVAGQTISVKARRALRENRKKDAAIILMNEYGLTCVEAGDLLDVSAC